METLGRTGSADPSNAATSRHNWRAAGVVLGAGLGMLLNVGPVFVFTFGIFLNPIAQQTGWDTILMASAIGPAMLLAALAQPVMGTILDRYGPRGFSFFSLTAFACGLILLGLVPRSESGFVAFLVLTICLGAGQTPLPYSYLVSSWFDKRRGLALGIALSFSGLGVAAWPHIAGFLISAVGWRKAYVGLGIAVLLLGVFSAIGLIRDPVKHVPGGERLSNNVSGIDLPNAIKLRSFWILVISFFTMSAIITGATMHLPAMLMNKGFSLQAAASIASIVGITSIVSRLLIGSALDKIFPPIVTFLVFLAPALGCFVLLEAGVHAAPLAAGLIGVGLGAEADALAYIASRAFGIKHFGAVYGALMVVFLVGVSAGPSFFAFFLAGRGGYEMALTVSGAGGGLAALLTLLLRKRDLRHA